MPWPMARVGPKTERASLVGLSQKRQLGRSRGFYTTLYSGGCRFILGGGGGGGG